MLPECQKKKKKMLATSTYRHIRNIYRQARKTLLILRTLQNITRLKPKDRFYILFSALWFMRVRM